MEDPSKLIYRAHNKVTHSSINTAAGRGSWGCVTASNQDVEPQSESEISVLQFGAD